MRVVTVGGSRLGGRGEDAEALVGACPDRAAAEVSAVGLQTGGAGLGV